MEAWEEDSNFESCRSSVISDLDELEANLYSFVHHERNDVDESHSNECRVLLFEEGIRNSPEIFRDITKQNISTTKDVDVSENEKSTKQDVSSDCKNKLNLDHSKPLEQEYPIEITDSRYNVGCNTKNPVDAVVPVSPVTLTAEVKTISSVTPDVKCNSPPVIDVLSSSDEDVSVDKTNKQNVLPKTNQSIEEVVVLDDSDSDIRIELEKVNFKRKKLKRKSNNDIEADIKLNTEKPGKVSRKEGSGAHFPELDRIQSSQSSKIKLMPVKDTLLQTPVCKNWTPQMVKFYNESWGGECMNLSEIQMSMSDQGWNVDVTDEVYDLTGRTQNRRYYVAKSKGWCTNCSRKGHYRNECPDVIRKPNCYRCGSSNHSVSNCRYKICLTCGVETNVLITACTNCSSERDRGKSCSVCRQFGHPTSCCPDQWRKYHSTVAPGIIICPQKPYKKMKNLYCCNCARKGHHIYQCTKPRYTDYIPQNPHVIHYKLKKPKRTSENIIPAFSENWHKVRREAPKHCKETTRIQELTKEKRGTKRVKTSEHTNNSKIIKLTTKDGRARTKEKPNGTHQIPAKINLPKAKKKQKKKEQTQGKLNQRNSQSLKDLGGIVLSREQNTVECPVKKSKPIETKGNSNQCNTSSNNYEIIPIKRKMLDREVKLTEDQYNILTTRQGEEVLKHVTRQVNGSAVTPIQGKNMIMLIGTKTSTLCAKRLLLQIISNIQNLSNFDGSTSVIQKGVLDNTTGQKKKSKKVVKPAQTEADLRVEIKTNDLQTARNVKCLSNNGSLETKQTSSKRVKQKEGNNSSSNRNLPVKISHFIDPEKAKANIQRNARNLLSEQEISYHRVRDYAQWALSLYRNFLSKSIKRRLQVLKKNRAPEFLKKDLTVIANW